MDAQSSTTGYRDGYDGRFPKERNNTAYMRAYTYGRQDKAARHEVSFSIVFESERMFSGTRKTSGRAEY